MRRRELIGVLGLPALWWPLRAGAQQPAIPVIGYLDDLIIVPLGIVAVVKLIPPEIMAEHRVAAAMASERPTSRMAAAVIALIWIASMALVGWVAYRYFVSASST